MTNIALFMGSLANKLKVRKGFTKGVDWIPVLGIVPFVRNAPSEMNIENYIGMHRMTLGEVFVLSSYTVYQIASVGALGLGLYRQFN